MKVLIHAVPRRMWYVTKFLVPELERQGADQIEIWNDSDKLGNLHACMKSFEARTGHDATWHIQDDVLLCRDFVKRCREHDKGVAVGFCCRHFYDDPTKTGTVYIPDAWGSFQCVRIPDDYARECAAWFTAGEWQNSPNADIPLLYAANKGDDTFFHEFLQMEHGRETVENIAPNLVEHVDYIIGGSTLHWWRDALPVSDHWDDKELVQELKIAVRPYVKHVN